MLVKHLFVFLIKIQKLNPYSLFKLSLCSASRLLFSASSSFRLLLSFPLESWGENLSDVPIWEQPLSLLPRPPHHAPSGKPLSRAESTATVSVKDTRGQRGLRALQRWGWCYRSNCFTWRSLQSWQSRTRPVCGIVFPREPTRTWRIKKKHKSAWMSEKSSAHLRRWNPPWENSFASSIHKYSLID